MNISDAPLFHASSQSFCDYLKVLTLSSCVPEHKSMDCQRYRYLDPPWGVYDMTPSSKQPPHSLECSPTRVLTFPPPCIARPRCQSRNSLAHALFYILFMSSGHETNSEIHERK